MTTEAFVKAFRYRKGSILGLWRDVSRDAEPQGDCQSFGWSVLCLEAGGKLRALLAMLTFRAVIWRAYSPVNGAIPRHAVLWLRGKGYIDSSDRYWRPSPKPHRPVYPAGLPVLLALAFLILGSPAFAQTPQCGPLPDALAALEAKYQEQPRVSALTSGGQLMVITASQDGGFSVLLVSPEGSACMVASGSAFEVLPQEPAGVDG